MDRAIRESVRGGDPLRTGILLKRAGRVEEALDVFEQVWASKEPVIGDQAGELLLDLLLSQPDADRGGQAARLDRLAWQGLDGAEALWSAWFPAAACLVGWSQPMRQLREFLYGQSASDDPIILWGEAGAGHEVAAQALHALSDRTGYHEAYAPGSRRRLLAEIAEDPPRGGTLYLSYANDVERWEEVVLDACRRRNLRLVVGIVSSSDPHVPLAGSAVPSFQVPALRDRFEDLPLVLDDLLTSVGAPVAAAAVGERVINFLRWHDWPGNVRELANLVKQAVLTSERQEVIPELLVQLMIGLPGETASEAVA